MKSLRSFKATFAEGLAPLSRDLFNRFGKDLVCLGVDRFVYNLFTGRMVGQTVAVFPVDLWPDRARDKAATAIRADVVQHILHAIGTESTFKGADHGFGRAGR